MDFVFFLKVRRSQKHSPSGKNASGGNIDFTRMFPKMLMISFGGAK